MNCKTCALLATILLQSQLCNSQLDGCAMDLAKASTTMNGNKIPYSLVMEDASGKLPSGVFQGNTISPGSYDECYNDVSEDDLGYSVSFIGVQVNITEVVVHLIQTNQTVPPILYGFAAAGTMPSVGVCGPTSCSSNDDVVKLLKILSGSTIPASAVRCVRNTSFPVFSVSTQSTIDQRRYIRKSYLEAHQLVHLVESRSRSAVFYLCSLFAVRCIPRVEFRGVLS